MFDNSKKALAHYDATQADRDAMFNVINTKEEFEEWDVADKRATAAVLHAFWVDTKEYNNQSTVMNCMSVSFVRETVEKYTYGGEGQQKESEMTVSIQSMAAYGDVREVLTIIREGLISYGLMKAHIQDGPRGEVPAHPIPSIGDYFEYIQDLRHFIQRLNTNASHRQEYGPRHRPYEVSGNFRYAALQALDILSYRIRPERWFSPPIGAVKTGSP